ncbi:rhomboid family intramembrane serine protease [Virgibacillus sp. 179-BFC.A HS]|uniref:Rhomboid family intramembrane serine protease n=1 Tax=Tigheibacillus jepli TaxID=3035914 RepID=A0ABU5CM81_9BACI|nr:rhomboid family intramembrane serine protease [Virgibacillus sp. 179-BFC.A HS]MDY0406904.1 rhomboid family intramembrane serine protease [Virgibacillus sp. 179-BFC.A HS]
MFIRNEKSVKDFIRLYPVVSTLIIIHFVLWIIIDLLKLPIGESIYNYGAGVNLFIHAGEYWRLITPIFLHANLMHTLFNSFSLLIFGPALEQMLGKGKFIFAYFFAGIVGNIATYAFHPTAFMVFVGASGAIYGLFGIYMFMVLFRKHLVDRSDAQIVIVIFVIGLIMTFLQPNINIHAHVFGFIAGFALGPIILNNVRPYSPWRTYVEPKREDIGFDPNRWQKKHIIPAKIRRNWIWIILGILVILGLLSRIGLF